MQLHLTAIFIDVEQLNVITQLIGRPADEYIETLESEPVKQYLHALPPSQRQDFTQFFQGVDPLGMNLIKSL